MNDNLDALGASAQDYQFEKPDKHILERFEAPTWENLKDNPTGAQQISIQIPEFTSLCPKTGQPDFAKIIIEYAPKQWCIESKSLKLYMFSFRNHGEFHESCVNRITTDLVAVLDPWWMQVQGQFTPRGGIPFWPTQRWENPLLRQPAGGGLLVPGGTRGH